MAHEFSWWLLFNKFLNFFVLLAACWYLVRAYLTPWIRATLQERAAFQSALIQEANDLHLKCSTTVQETETQQAYSARLLVKIQAWKTALEKKQQLYLLQEQALEKKCHAYLQKRADGLCQERLKQATFPRVIAQTNEQVRAFFKDKNEQARYMQKLLASLPQGKR